MPIIPSRPPPYCQATEVTRRYAAKPAGLYKRVPPFCKTNLRVEAGHALDHHWPLDDENPTVRGVCSFDTPAVEHRTRTTADCDTAHWIVDTKRLK